MCVPDPKLALLTRPGLVQPILISLIAFTLGYQYRTYSLSSTSLPSPSSSPSPSQPAITTRRSSSSSAAGSIDGTDTDSDAEDESAALTSDIASLKANLTEEVKLVLVINDSLKMAKGKIAAQAGHATLACALLVRGVNPKVRLKTPLSLGRLS